MSFEGLEASWRMAEDIIISAFWKNCAYRISHAELDNWFIKSIIYFLLHQITALIHLLLALPSS